MVYGRVNRQENSCLCVVGNLDRNPDLIVNSAFCTFDPVDIHQVVHIRLQGAGSSLVGPVSIMAMQACRIQVQGVCKEATADHENFFFRELFRFTTKICIPRW